MHKHVVSAKLIRPTPGVLTPMSVSKLALISYWRNSGLVEDEKILQAFESVPRENFVLKQHKEDAYMDEPLPLMEGQTISQPTTVAIMTQAAEIEEGQKVLEIGAGSGYQAAILSKLAGKEGNVFTIERIKKLADYARKNLKSYRNVSVIHADGTKGYSKEEPYDRIVVTAAASELPKEIFKQLASNGIMVIPIEDHLFKITKVRGRPKMQDLGLFVFVPLVKGIAE